MTEKYEQVKSENDEKASRIAEVNIYTHVPITSNLTLAWWVVLPRSVTSFTNNHIVRPIVRKQTGLLQSTGDEFC